MSNKTIFIASDHGGFELKQKLIAWMKENGFDPQDMGTDSTKSVNASEFAVRVASAMRADPASFGVLICRSGQAMAMTANRFRHIRAALCVNGFMARKAREHNDANLLALGADVIGEGLAVECLETFLKTEFLAGRFEARCQILADLGGL